MSTIDANLLDGKFKLKDIVEYQDNTIVSRAFLKKPTGNLTAFAFDAGQELSEHTAPFDAYVIILDGDAEIRIGGNPFELTEGESIIMPANVPHALKAISKFKMLLIMIKS